MKKYWKISSLVALQLFTPSAYAEQSSINALRYWNTPDQAQMLFDVTASPEHRVFLMNNPSRLVIDLRNTDTKQQLTQPPLSHPLFSKVRSAVQNNTDLRIVVDLKQDINAKTMSLRTNSLNQHGHRLVVELMSKTPGQFARAEGRAEASPAVTTTTAPTVKETPIQSSVTTPAAPVIKAAPVPAIKKTLAAPIQTVSDRPNFVVAIDAGHGGNDPGAHGQNGTEEKRVTLAIAKQLADLINQEPGMKAVLVRKGDYYVDLRKRMQIARSAKANLFVSIHADAYQDPTVQGASVFTLSSKGATSEAARWLANSENASDLVGGVSLNDKEDVLASVLLDLSQTATQDASVNVASHVLKNFERIGELHHASVQKAGFMVLKSPDIPSILVETAFISNPIEELKLVNKEHQVKIAGAIFSGVRSYFEDTMPASNVAALDLP
jgi:N-acetylmuramoyl-L-alanine amidase